MKAAKEQLFLDIVADDNDSVQVEIQRRPNLGPDVGVVYVHVNGQSVLRIGFVNLKNLEVQNNA